MTRTAHTRRKKNLDVHPFDGPLRFQQNRHKSSNATPRCHVPIEIHLHHRPATGRILIDVLPERPTNCSSAPVDSKVLVPLLRVLVRD